MDMDARVRARAHTRYMAYAIHAYVCMNVLWTCNTQRLTVQMNRIDFCTDVNHIILGDLPQSLLLCGGFVQPVCECVWVRVRLYGYICLFWPLSVYMRGKSRDIMGERERVFVYVHNFMCVYLCVFHDARVYINSLNMRRCFVPSLITHNWNHACYVIRKVIYPRCRDHL